MKRLILVKPNSTGQYFDNDLRGYEPPLWLCVLASYYCLMGYDPIILDAEIENLDCIETLNKIIDYNPDKVFLLATGNHPSSFIQMQSSINELETLLQMQGIDVEAKNYLPISPLKFKPRWDLIDHNKYRCHNWQSMGGLKRSPYGVTYTSISCNFNCHFCNIRNFYKSTFQTRYIDDIIDDFDELVLKYNVKTFKIMDELFAIKNNRVEQICQRLAEKDYAKDLNIWCYARIDTINKHLLQLMRKAGICWVAYGIEHGNEDIRQNMLKGKFTNQIIKDTVKMTQDNGINVIGNYMFGFWGDNYDTMQQTLDFAIELNCEFANFYCLVCYPDSRLYKEYKEKGVNVKRYPIEYAQMSEHFYPMSTKYLRADEVLIFRDKAFFAYFSNINYLNSIKDKFGIGTYNQILEINKIKIKRNICR